MLAPQTRRIHQLPSFTSPTTQLSGAYTVWEVPMGPVAGGYKTMRGTPEDLAAYLALGALLKRASLTSARALLAGVAPQPVVDGGVLYAIEDTRWNGGPGATVYVHGLDSGQFAPVGYGPVAGKMVLVNVDVVAGKYTEFAGGGGTGLATASYKVQSAGAQTITDATNATWFGVVGIRTAGGKSITLDPGTGFTFTAGVLTILAAAGAGVNDIITYTYASGVIGALPTPQLTPAQLAQVQALSSPVYIVSDTGVMGYATMDDALAAAELLEDCAIFCNQKSLTSAGTTAAVGYNRFFGQGLLFGPSQPIDFSGAIVHSYLSNGETRVLNNSAQFHQSRLSLLRLDGTAVGLFDTQILNVVGRGTLYLYGDTPDPQSVAPGITVINRRAPIFGSLPLTATRAAAYTLALADAGCMVPVSSTSAVTITVPDHATCPFPDGTTLYVAQDGIGAVTIAPASGVVVQTADGYKVGGQWQDVALHKRNLNTWVLKGGVS